MNGDFSAITGVKEKQQSMTEKIMYRKIRTALLKETNNGIIFHRIENRTSAGLPDILCFHGKLTYWIELKALHPQVGRYQHDLYSKVQPEHLMFLWLYKKGVYHVGFDDILNLKVRNSQIKAHIPAHFVCSDTDYKAFIQYVNNIRHVEYIG